MSNRLYSRKGRCEKCGTTDVEVNVNQYFCLKCGHKGIIQNRIRDYTKFKRGTGHELHDFYDEKDFKGRTKTLHNAYRGKYKLNKSFRRD